MSEMEYENLPEAHVPLVRFWVGRAYDGWSRFLYPPRRSFWFAWGWFLIIPLIWIALKFYAYAIGFLLLTVAQILTAIYDMATWYWRDKAAQRALLEGYAHEVYDNQSPRGEYPPPVAG